MKLQEQQAIKQKSYAEAMSCLSAARDILQKAPKDGPDFLKYKRDVRKVSFTAYKGMLIALRAYLKLKGIPLNRQQSNDVYYLMGTLYKNDASLWCYSNSAYTSLYRGCYCEGMSGISLIELGFSRVMKVLNKIKPQMGALK